MYKNNEEIARITEQYKSDEERERHRKMVGAILRMCELAGYSMESRIVLKDMKTGKIWK